MYTQIKKKKKKKKKKKTFTQGLYIHSLYIYLPRVYIFKNRGSRSLDFKDSRPSRRKSIIINIKFRKILQIHSIN